MEQASQQHRRPLERKHAEELVKQMLQNGGFRMEVIAHISRLSLDEVKKLAEQFSATEAEQSSAE